MFQIPAFVVCHVLLALAMQLKSVGDNRYSYDISTAFFSVFLHLGSLGL